MPRSSLRRETPTGEPVACGGKPSCSTGLTACRTSLHLTKITITQLVQDVSNQTIYEQGSKNLKISIGILAYNEANEISITLHSLFQQSLFKKADGNTTIEIVVVPNGCTDNTAAIATATLKELTQGFTQPCINWRVCEVKEPGKANAWNLYVHEFSAPTADYLLLMDADIHFLDPHTLYSMINTLETTPSAWVSVDKSVKDVALKPKKNLIEKLSVSVSNVSGAKSAWICGQLYCARGEVLRKIWMPKGVLVEDGFLWTMVVTDCLTCQEVLDRVVLADTASHVFEAYTDPKSLFRHELRQVVGNTINSFIYTELRLHCQNQQDAGSLIKSRNEQDPLWLNKLIGKTVTQKGRWVIPEWLLLRRFYSLQNRPLHKAILLLPMLVIAFFVDVLLCCQGNSELQRWNSSSYALK